MRTTFCWTTPSDPAGPCYGPHGRDPAGLWGWVENLLQSDPLADRQESGCGEHAEAMALYAEFAIDFAMQAMRYALITALSAMELQMQADENMKKGDCDTYE